MPAATVTRMPAAVPVLSAAGGALAAALPPAAPKRHAMSTPAKAGVIGALVVFCALLAMSTGFEKVSSVRAVIHTIARDTKPSVVAALQIRSDLGTMDAEATNEALGTSGESVGLLGPFLDAARKYEKDFVAASENVSFGEAEREPLRRLSRSMTDYQQALGRIQGAAASGLVADTHRRVEAASSMLAMTAVPAAEDLKQANLKPLVDSYDSFVSSRTAMVEVLAILCLLAGAVAAAQVFAFHRLGQVLVTPFSGVAAVLIAVAVVTVPYELQSSRSDVVSAKTDAFDSILALNESKASMERMNALESLWLYTSDPARRADAETAFNQQAAAVLNVADPSQLALFGRFGDVARDTLAKECSGDSTGAHRATPTLKGLLGTALDNVTYGCAERTPLTGAVSAFLDYLRIDRQIRVLEVQGKHADALALCTGSEQGQSNWAFARVQSALDETVAVNDTEFNRSTDDAQSVLAHMAWLLGLLVGGAALLQCADLWIRTRDYR